MRSTWASRSRGLSVRMQLTLSYAVVVLIVGVAFAVVGLLVLRFVPEGDIRDYQTGDFAPARSALLAVAVRYAALALLVLAVLGLGGGWILAGRMLEPLTLITDTAEHVRDGSLDHRVRMPGRRNELSELADTFDEMLDRLNDSLELQERFAANASHELRTPLAVTGMMLEVAARDPDHQDYPALLERLRITNDRAVGLTESLLRLADANVVGAASTSVDLGRIISTAIADNTHEARQRGVTFHTRIEAQTITGDAGLVTQLVGNLVQNAIRHSGAQGSAWISTCAEPDRRAIALRVESTGAVFDAETAARLAEPFLRGAGRLSAGGGHGLGLALVERIAAVHGGSLTIRPRLPDGLVITVEFPGRPMPALPARA